MNKMTWRGAPVLHSHAARGNEGNPAAEAEL